MFLRNFTSIFEKLERESKRSIHLMLKLVSLKSAFSDLGIDHSGRCGYNEVDHNGQ